MSLRIGKPERTVVCNCSSASDCNFRLTAAGRSLGLGAHSRQGGMQACRHTRMPYRPKVAARPSLDPGILPAARKRVGHRQCNAAIAGSFQEVMASWRPVLARAGQIREFAGDHDGMCQHVMNGCGQRNVFKSPLRGIRDGPQFAWRTRSGAKAGGLNARGSDLGQRAV